MEEFIKNIPTNGKFLYSAFNEFTNRDIINLLERNGLKVKEERGNRIFPVTDKSQDVLNCFENELKKLGVKVLLESKVTDILLDKSKNIKGVKTENGEIMGDKIIIATGGKSYPLTGSTGDGYIFAKKVGHNIIKARPSLVPLEVHEKNMCSKLQGLSLKNVKIKIEDKTNKKTIYEDFGEMLFTHFGVSGPIVLSLSAHLVRYKNIENLLNTKNIKFYIDLKPALTEEQLDLRVLRDFEENKNKNFKNSLNKLLPQKLIPIIIELSKINPEKQVNSITKQERLSLVKLLKKFELTIRDFRKIDEAIITNGGIDIKEVNPKTMESKLLKGLYFAGEILDVDGYTGGFNLQIAYSTGFIAGQTN